jgi:hypothetical protein
VEGIFHCALFSESPVKQLELLYRKVLWTYPVPARASARNPLRARVDDGLDYMLKDDSGPPIRAREWISHRLADRAGVPVVEHLPILTAGGRILFGSRVVLNGGTGGTHMLTGTLKLAEASEVLSATYALDLFLGNGDRHPDNFLIENDTGGSPRIRVIDYSEAVACIEPGKRTNVPGLGCHTVNIGRQLRAHYGFSVPAACLALDRLAAVASVKEIIDAMPADWLPPDARIEIAAWWSSAARGAHITAIRNGVSNGTFL